MGIDPGVSRLGGEIVSHNTTDARLSRRSDGKISLTFGDLERSDQGHLLKNRVSVRDSTKVTIEH